MGEKTDYIDPGTAAERLGVTLQNLHGLLDRGTLPSRVVSTTRKGRRVRVVPAEAVELLAQARELERRAAAVGAS